MLLNNINISGMFKRCLKIPALQSGNAAKYAEELMDTFDREKSIDIDRSNEKRDSAFSTDYLFSNARGQMFGILLCINRKGETIILKAFSGQYNSRWKIPGWVPPVIDPEEFDNAVRDKDIEIKRLDKEIADLKDIKNKTDADNISANQQTETIKQLKDTRKKISQDLMKEIHSLYYLNNFKGEKKLMSEVFNKNTNQNASASTLSNYEERPVTCTWQPGQSAMPCGTGDCCAPKLLNFAAKEKLIPLSLIEFYYGKENKSGTKVHRHFYPPCTDKCEPILGYMMSGIKRASERIQHFDSVC